ncbi:MAG: sensor histidine kinase [Treponema sp.]|nr:sensor histidine kinase [Treponema sp.]
MDRQLFERALENIFGNALRYTDEGDDIIIRVTDGDRAILVSVADTGHGIAEEQRSHIFDLFYRGTASRREEGFGIGLSVVKQVIDSHGWTIAVDSEPGAGTVFTISIPIATEI